MNGKYKVGPLYMIVNLTDTERQRLEQSDTKIRWIECARKMDIAVKGTEEEADEILRIIGRGTK